MSCDIEPITTSDFLCSFVFCKNTDMNYMFNIVLIAIFEVSFVWDNGETINVSKYTNEKIAKAITLFLKDNNFEIGPFSSVREDVNIEHYMTPGVNHSWLGIYSVVTALCSESYNAHFVQKITRLKVFGILDYGVMEQEIVVMDSG